MESNHQNLHQRRMKWATRLEEVLNDFDALQLFQSWMGVDDDSSEHPLRLHFAIVAFRQMLADSDPRAAQLAREIYNKFLRPKSGLCAFIDVGTRERVGQRLRHLGPREMPGELFDECLAPLDTFLRKQHALFVSSHEFLDKFNNSLCIDDFPPPSSSSVQKTPIRRPKKQQADSSSERPALTADMLLRSQKEREAMVPAGAASQRLFKPVSKFPYVGQTQPSKNDSAVSSAISSEANRGSYSLRMIRDEQRRINPPLMATFPRLDHGPAFRTESQQSANQFRHDTTEGRQQFADLLIRKLQAVQLRNRHDESVDAHINLINLAMQKDAKQSARELIGQGGPELLEDSAGVDADEELESYYRLKMAADSNSSANSAQQSPLVPLSRRTRRRSRGHGSCSPIGGGGNAPQMLMMDWGNSGAMGMGAMSQSCCSANPSSSLHAAFLGAAGQSQANNNGPRGNNRPPLPPPHQHFPLLESSDRSLLSFPPPPVHFGMPPFSAFSPQMPSTSSMPHSHPLAAPPSMPSLITQSMHLPSNSSIPQPKAPSTPLMGLKGQQSKNPAVGYCDNDGDTSGIGSMTSATHSGTSAPGTAEQRERQRAAVFRKARELSSGGGATERQKQQQQSLGGANAANSACSGIPRQKQPPQSSAGSLPRPTRATLPQQPQFNAQSPQNSKMTISYREGGANGNGVPVVAQIPRRHLTFREFRRILSISSKDRRQFFFKIACEDGSAPYQLLLVNDDQTVLPIFDGKITAECRSPLSDSD